MRAAGGEQRLGAARQAHPLEIDALERRFAEPLQQRDARDKRLCEVEFALHRALGDRGDLGFQPVHVCDLVDAFDGDQRRIHVGDDQPVVGETRAVGDARDVDAKAGGQR